MSRTRTNYRRQAGLVTDLTPLVGLPLGMFNPKTQCSHTCHTQCLANTLMRCILTCKCFVPYTILSNHNFSCKNSNLPLSSQTA